MGPKETMPESSPSGAAPSLRRPVRPPLRIALCHLDSLVCLPGLNVLFAEMGEQIGLVVLSRRFGPKHGGLFTQLRRGVRRSGWRMTLWLGFDIVAAQIVSVVAAMTAPFLGRQRRLQSLRALASQHGARVIEVADVNNAETVAAVSAYAPDLVVVFNFDQILQPGFIEVPRAGVLNVHPSLLPAFRGPCPVFWALAQGGRETGISIHAITNADIDAGPVIRQQQMGMERARSAAEITSALFVAGARLLPEAVEELASHRPCPAHRPARQPSPGDYHGFPAPEDVARAARQGIRLWRPGFVLRLIAAAIVTGRV